MQSTIHASGQPILVTGAGGFVGRAVVGHLLKGGYTVRAMTRNGTINLPAHPKLETVAGNMTDAKSVDRCVSGIQAVIHLAARKADEADSEAVNVGGATHLIDAAKHHDIKRIVNVSTQSVRLKRRGVYGETKLNADQLFAASRLPIVTLRPSVVYGNPGEGIFGVIFAMLRLPIVPIIGSGAIRFWPIQVEDLAHVLERALSVPGIDGNVYDVGGPDAVSFNELVITMMHRSGIHKTIIHLPIWAALLIAKLTSWFPRPPITVSNVLGSITEVIVDSSAIRRDLGVEPRKFSDGLVLLTEQLENQKRRTEAGSLLRYVLPTINTDPAMIDRLLLAYSVHQVDSHRLDSIVIGHPSLLAMIETAAILRRSPSMLRTKLLITAAIAETTPASAAMLLPRDRSVIGILLLSAWISAKSAVLTLSAATLMLLAPRFLKRNGGY